MKKAIFFSSILLSFSLFSQQLTTKLEACYGLAGGANDPVNGLNGTLGSVTLTSDRNNVASECYNFSGTPSSLITLPDDPKLKDQTMSVSVWAKPQVINGSYIVFAKNNFSSFHEAYALSMDGIKFVAAKCNTNGNSYQYSTTTPLANTWYHLVLCVSKTTLSLYVNGVLESTGSTSGNIEYQAGKNVQIGGSGESYFPGAFQGDIDNVRFYSRILTQADVNDLYSIDPPCSSSPQNSISGPGPGPTPVAGASCIPNAKAWSQGGNISPPDNTIGTCDNFDFVLKANNQPTIHIESSNNNVGIGTLSPGFKLDVNGDARVSTDLVVDNSLSVINSSAGPGGRIYAGNGKSVKGVGLLNSYDNNGSLGLWVETNVVSPNTYNAVFAARHKDAKSITVLDLSTLTGLAPFNYKQTFTVLGDGRTGIGVANPQAKLEVSETGAHTMRFFGNQWGDIESSGSFRPHFATGTDFAVWEGPIGGPPNASLRFILKNGRAGIGSNNPEDRLQVGDDYTKVVMGSSSGQMLNYGTGYIGFNASRQNPGNTGATWTTGTDFSHNGGGAIWGDVFGNMFFATIPHTGTANQTGIADANVMSNAHLKILASGQVQVGSLLTNNAKFSVNAGFGDGLKVTTSNDYSKAFNLLNTNTGKENFAVYGDGTANISDDVNSATVQYATNYPRMAVSVVSPVGFTPRTAFYAEVKNQNINNPYTDPFGYCGMFVTDNNKTKALAVINSISNVTHFMVLGDGSTRITVPSYSTTPNALEVADFATQQVNFRVKSNGDVFARYVRVTLQGFPDYVFNADYKLMPLQQVKEYIDKNHHLPNVPPAAQMEKDGADLGELGKIQMEKIEEVYLYLIEMKREIETLKKENSELKLLLDK
jgi:hypothetical protein